MHRIDDRLPPRRELHVWWLRAREAPPDEISAVLDGADELAWVHTADEHQRSVLQWRRALTRLVVGYTLDRPAESVLLARTCALCGDTDHGRPVVPGERFTISSAAADGIVAVAVAVDLQIGIDVIAKADVDIAIECTPALCVADDANALQALGPDVQGEASLGAIAQLEAYAKASGVGRWHRTQDVVVSLDPVRPAVSAEGRSWWSRRIDPGPAYIAMLVADQRPRAVRTLDATSLLVDRMQRSAAPA